MAVAALPVKVTAWSGVTGLALGEAAVVEAGIAPGSCVMAAAALPIVMTAWSGMTGLAISTPVVKDLTAPGRGAVTATALSAVVVSWCGMTRAAVCGVGRLVIEISRQPCKNVMAG